jgi:hypothetical protein
MEHYWIEELMTRAPGWVEYGICREIFGIVQHVASRPLSKGHDGALHNARFQLRDACQQLDQIDRSILSPTLFALIRTLVQQPEQIPLEVIARTLVGSLGSLLSQNVDPGTECPCCFVDPPGDLSLERLVVAVGPTIGLGDEVLAARALVERVRAFTGMSIHVSTHHFDLWKSLQGPVCPLPPPPLGAFGYLDSLSPAERQRTAFLYADFLNTDLSPYPYSGPSGIAYGGRWSMGAEECDFVDLTKNLRHCSRYPDGLPACRWLEARWMAGRVLPGRSVATPPLKSPSAERRRPRKRIIVQTLTAKPRLTFPPEFYRRIFLRVIESIPDLELEIIPNPTSKGQALVMELLDALKDVVPSAVIPAPGATSLSEVFERLAGSDLLFGPDTFTSHWAAVLGLPQVTVSLPEHAAWRTIESPCLSVVADRPQAELVDPCARRIVALLQIDELLDEPRFVSGSLDWRRSVTQLERTVEQYLQSGLFDQSQTVTELIRHVEHLYLTLAPEIGRRTKIGTTPAPLRSLDLAVFNDLEDRARVLARWYHAVQLTETAAILGAL